jgi:hypothetical protein
VTVYALNQTPTTIRVGWLGNTALATSGLIGSAQTVDRQGLKWQIQYGFEELRGDNRADLLGTIALLRTQSHRLRVPVYDNPRRGAYGGTPLVNGASQTGNTLNIDGASTGITNWIRKGDYFSVIVGTEPELKIATADANSDGSGNVTLTFEPRLRTSPANGAAIHVEDGVLTVPAGIFLLANPEISWESIKNRTTHSVVILDLIEDVFATQ